MEAGILLVSWMVVRIGWCRLPSDVSWRGVAVIGCVGGTGFTMAIFIATLAFTETASLGAAKLGVLAASAAAGLAWSVKIPNPPGTYTHINYLG